MRIEGPYQRNTVAKKRAGRSVDGQSFSVGQQETAVRADAPGMSAPVSELDAILALQAVDDPLLAKKRAVRHGQNLLDALDDIKADLLVGRIGEGRVNRLAALISKARDLSDPQIDSLLDDIELRAKVELAKLGH